MTSNAPPDVAPVAAAGSGHRESHHRFDVPARPIRRQQHTHFATPISVVLAPAYDSAARPGSCRKPPGALHIESGEEWLLSTSLIVRCGRTSPSRSAARRVRRYRRRRRTQPPPTGRPRPEPEFLRPELPRNPRIEHKQDPAEHLAETIQEGCSVTLPHIKSNKSPFLTSRATSHPSSHQEQQVTLPHIKSNKPDALTYSKIILLGVLSLGRLRRASQEDRDSRYSILHFAV